MNLNDLVLPLESAEFVMKSAKSVKLNQNGIDKLSAKVKISNLASIQLRISFNLALFRYSRV